MQRQHLFHQRFSTRQARILLPGVFGAAPIGRRNTLAQTPTVAEKDDRAVKDEVGRFSQLEADGDILSIIRSYHPDSLDYIPGYVVAGWYRDEFFPKGPHKVETVGDVKHLNGWIWPVNGTPYDVSEVRFRQTFDDGDVLEDVSQLAVNPQGDFGPFWWFFGDTREFADAQVETYHDRLVAGAIQTDFQLLSFPPREIDLAAELPPIWEDFVLSEHGEIVNAESGAWARYVHEGCETGCAPSEEIQVSWTKVVSANDDPTAFDHALRAQVHYGLETPGFNPGLLMEPDLKLVETMKDDSYVRVQAPAMPMMSDRITDRLVFMVLDGDTAWYHMVQATFTDPQAGLTSRFASSLPYIAV